MPAGLEHNAGSIQQLCLPLCDLISVHIELLCQLRDCLVAFDCLLILSPITWLISGLESTYNAVRFLGSTSLRCFLKLALTQFVHIENDR